MKLSWKQRAAAVSAVFLLFAAVIFAGGCDGSSSSAKSENQAYMVAGTLSDTYKTLLDSADSVYDGTTDIVFGDSGLDAAEADPKLAAKIKGYFEAGGRAALLASHPATSGEIARLAALLDLPSDDAAYMEGFAGALLFGCEKEDDGDIHVFVHNSAETTTVSEDSPSATGPYAFRLGSIVRLISGDEELTTTDVSIKIVSVDTADRIEARSGDKVLDCAGFADLDAGKAYTQSGDLVYEHVIETRNSSGDAAEISSSDLQIGFTHLINWADGNYEGEFLNSSNVSSSTGKAIKTVFGATQSGSDTQQKLLDVAKIYTATYSNAQWEKSLLVNMYVVSCHEYDGTNSENGGRDLYLFKEAGALDGSNHYRSFWAGHQFHCYIKDNESFVVNQGEVRDAYIKHYLLYNSFLNPPSSLVKHGASPTATNNANSTTTTSGFSLSASGSIGVKGKDPEASFGVGAGYSSTVAYSFSTNDVDVELTSNGGKQSELIWNYIFKSARWQGSSHSQSLFDPATLSHSMFEPVNTWVWQVDTKDRTDGDTLKVSIQPVAETTAIKCSGSVPPRVITRWPTPTDNYMALPHPPLISCSAPYRVKFDKTGGSRTFDVFVQGTAEIDDASAARKAGIVKFASADIDGNFNDGHYSLTVEAAPNNTGRTRTMSASIYRRKGDGSHDANDTVLFYIDQEK